MDVPLYRTGFYTWIRGYHIVSVESRTIRQPNRWSKTATHVDDLSPFQAQDAIIERNSLQSVCDRYQLLRQLVPLTAHVQSGYG